MTEEKSVTPSATEENIDNNEQPTDVAENAKTALVSDYFANVDLDSVDDSLESLLKAGVHFGHQKSRRHPRMAPYIFGVRGMVTIIDLEKTQKGIRDAQDFLTSVRKSGKRILFVTTKKQMIDLVKSAAQRVDEPYVVRRWIGGTFTNFSQIRNRVRALIRMEEEMEKGFFRKYTKLEQLKKSEEINKLNRKMGGLKNMDDLPGAIVVVDVKKDILAVREARRQGIPVVAITDTNADPFLVDYVIPANDDALSSVKVILSLLLKAINTITPMPSAASQRGSRRLSHRTRRSRKQVTNATTSKNGVK